jgi:hypothetical protein
MTTDPITIQERQGTLPLTCIIGDTLRHVYILSSDRWAAIPERRRRNLTAEYVPGWGWVVASPGRLS